ncbi:hypothetical protein [Clostridium brassicae]|uniref:MacB-like periplasmic core domain-containing protein n=1 Tax=Clostridium brassicae TaxID=2999072 RepID=A0ABT4D4R2_9CLOT|nr:hypothetical protein [Clostridium brassicae]MCY6957270.1 hypothetical protein [Clostridium brassicae]
MYYLKKKNIIFIVFFICLNLFAFSFLVYTVHQKQLSELSNGLYTRNYVVFNDNEPQKYIENLNNNNECRVFIEYNDVFRFFAQKNEKWKPPMQKGSFFSENIKGRKAVVGKEMVKHIKKYNGKDYISFQEEDYEVIGVMGASFVSRADYLILLQGEKIPTTGRMKVIVDSNGKSTINKMVNDITKEYKKTSYVQGISKGLYKTANTTFFYRLLSIDSFLLIICSIFIYLRYWYEKEKVTMYVMFLLGIPRKTIIGENIKKISLNVLIASFIANIIFLLKDNISFHIIKEIVFVDIFFLISSCIFALIFMIKAPIDNVFGK